MECIVLPICLGIGGPDSALIVTEMFASYEGQYSGTDYSDAFAQLEVHFTAFFDTLGMHFIVLPILHPSHRNLCYIYNFLLNHRAQILRRRSSTRQYKRCSRRMTCSSSPRTSSPVPLLWRSALRRPKRTLSSARINQGKSPTCHFHTSYRRTDLFFFASQLF